MGNTSYKLSSFNKKNIRDFPTAVSDNDIQSANYCFKIIDYHLQKICGTVQPELFQLVLCFRRLNYGPISSYICMLSAFDGWKGAPHITINDKTEKMRMYYHHAPGPFGQPKPAVRLRVDFFADESDYQIISLYTYRTWPFKWYQGLFEDNTLWLTLWLKLLCGVQPYVYDSEFFQWHFLCPPFALEVALLLFSVSHSIYKICPGWRY